MRRRVNITDVLSFNEQLVQFLHLCQRQIELAKVLHYRLYVCKDYCLLESESGAPGGLGKIQYFSIILYIVLKTTSFSGLNYKSYNILLSSNSQK